MISPLQIDVSAPSSTPEHRLRDYTEKLPESSLVQPLGPRPRSDTDDSDAIQQDPLVETFGDHPQARILSALIRADAPLTPARIVEVANIGRRTWYDHVDALLDTGLVQELDVAEIDEVLPVPSDATLYQLADNERADRLVDFYERYQIGQHDHLRAPGDQSDAEN